jgi:hypothetical protein
MANVPPLLGRPLDFTRESLERLKTAQFAENSSLDYKLFGVRAIVTDLAS